MPHQLLSINYFLIRYCIANDVQVSQLGLPLLQCCLCRDERFIFEGVSFSGSGSMDRPSVHFGGRGALHLTSLLYICPSTGRTADSRAFGIWCDRVVSVARCLRL